MAAQKLEIECGVMVYEPPPGADFDCVARMMVEISFKHRVPCKFMFNDNLYLVPAPLTEEQQIGRLKLAFKQYSEKGAYKSQFEVKE